MKICYLNPTILLKRPIAELSERLAKNKSNEIGLLMPKKLFKGLDKSLHYSELKNVKIYSYSVINPPFISSEWPIPGFKFLMQAWKALKENEVIHIWVPFYLSSTIFILLKGLFFRKRKLILTMDTIPAYSFSMGKFMDLLFKIYYKTLGKIVFYFCDCISIYGKSLIPYSKLAGMPIRKVKITPTGVNLEMKKQNKDIRKEFEIKKCDKIVLFVGLIVPRKGLDSVIQTANLMRNENISFILVGDGPARKKYEKKVIKIGLKDKITFTGFRKDVHNFYLQSDVFFFPSKGEGLAGAIMESMAYGLPVVSSRIPCTEDLIKDRENGFLCDKKDADCYADRINSLLNNKRLRDKFIMKSKEVIKKKFDWENNMGLFERLY